MNFPAAPRSLRCTLSSQQSHQQLHHHLQILYLCLRDVYCCFIVGLVHWIVRKSFMLTFVTFLLWPFIKSSKYSFYFISCHMISVTIAPVSLILFLRFITSFRDTFFLMWNCHSCSFPVSHLILSASPSVKGKSHQSLSLLHPEKISRTWWGLTWTHEADMHSVVTQCNLLYNDMDQFWFCSYLLSENLVDLGWGSDHMLT